MLGGVAGTGAGSWHRHEDLFQAPQGSGLVSVDRPGLTHMSSKGRGDMSQGLAVGEGLVGKCRALVSGLSQQRKIPGISESL